VNNSAGENEILVSKILKTWLAPLKENLPPLYMVGGSVRDHLLSRPPKDIDLVCTGAEDAARKLARANGAAFVPFTKKAGEPCFRVAVRGKPDNFIDFSPMHGGNLLTDLQRRDFTINAIALELGPDGTPGQIIDPLKGAADIEQGIIRMTGPGVFESDPLRILRAFRFAAALKFAVDSDTLSAVESQASLLKNVSAERILNELLETFRTPDAFSQVQMMDALGILTVIFPEISPMKGCAQNGFHHLDVWNHSLLVFQNCERILNQTVPDFQFGIPADLVLENLCRKNRIPLLKLSALLHDAGKPAHQSLHPETGRITFYGHQKTSLEIAFAVAERLRMSRQDQEYLCTVVGEHMKVLDLARPGVKQNTLARWFRKLGEDGVPVIIHGTADVLSTLGPDSSEIYRNNFIQWAENTIRDYYENLKPRLEQSAFISGRDLMALGMSPGPEMGRILTQVRQGQDAAQISNREEALALAEALMKQGAATLFTI
jgi:tRNA nucleotidyltransferase/poly(A) polymerase